MVNSHFSNTNADTQTLQMLILGSAGTGKSYLIGCLAQLLQEHCLLTGTTGIAGFNIHGVTLHSVVQLPVQSHRNHDLSGTTLANLQLKLNHVNTSL